MGLWTAFRVISGPLYVRGDGFRVFPIGIGRASLRCFFSPEAPGKVANADFLEHSE
jgi:hypothetical protein